MKLDIVYEDKDMIIVNKPAGVLSQSSKTLEQDLSAMVMTYRRKNNEDAYAAVINRLDRPVSGLVLFAKNKKSAAKLSQLIRKNTLNKQYYALICGKPDKESGTFVDYLVKDGRTNISRIAKKDEPQAKRAELRYEVVKHLNDSCTLVKIHLITGRHHQIRVQFASRNMPLLGDYKYQAAYESEVCSATQVKEIESKLLKPHEIALCAYSLTINDKTFTIEPGFVM